MAGTAGMTTVWSSAASSMHRMMPVMTRRICGWLYCGGDVRETS